MTAAIWAGANIKLLTHKASILNWNKIAEK